MLKCDNDQLFNQGIQCCQEVVYIRAVPWHRHMLSLAILQHLQSFNGIPIYKSVTFVIEFSTKSQSCMVPGDDPRPRWMDFPGVPRSPLKVQRLSSKNYVNIYA